MKRVGCVNVFVMSWGDGRVGLGLIITLLPMRVECSLCEVGFTIFCGVLLRGLGLGLFGNLVVLQLVCCPFCCRFMAAILRGDGCYYHYFWCFHLRGRASSIGLVCGWKMALLYCCSGLF
jgi:hypothetical protein